MSEKIKVGSEFWAFDGNRRIYAEVPPGVYRGMPIYAEKYYPVVVPGETSRSWIIAAPRADYELFKVPKKDPFREKRGESLAHPMIFTDKVKEDDVWVEGHRHRITESLQSASVDQLRQVAAIIGLKP